VACGTLAAIDFVPRRWSKRDVGVLAEMAALVERELAQDPSTTGDPPSGSDRVPIDEVPTRLFSDRALAGLLTLEGRTIRWANAEAARILGHPEDRLANMDLSAELLIDGLEGERLLREVGEADAGAEAIRVCTSIRRGDGEVLPIELRLARVDRADRNLIVGSIHDLSGSAARWRRALEGDLSGIVIASGDCHILDCNEEFARIVGLPSREAALGMEVDRLEPQPGEFAALVERLRRKGGETEAAEVEMIRSDGARVRVVARFAADFDPDGRPVEFRGWLLDVTQRALREAALQQASERLRLLELATRDVWWDWDLTTGSMTWNAAGARRFRYPAGEVRPSLEWHFERLHPDDRERVVSGLHQAISGVSEVWADEYRFLRGDGTYATVHDRAYVVRNGRGDAVRVTGWMVDVTDRRRTEESQRFLARVSTLLDATLDTGLTATSLATVCVPTLADFAILDRFEKDGSVHRDAVAHVDSAREQLLMAADSRERIEDPHNPILASARRGEPLLCAECPGDLLLRLDHLLGEGMTGRLGVHSYMVVPVVGRDRPIGALTLALTETGRRYAPVDLMVAEDLAHRAGLALENAQLYESAQHALQARERVLALVSHDLRGPLGTITATTDFLIENPPTDLAGVGRFMNVIKRSADQMTTLITDLLDVASVELGEFAVNPVPKYLDVLVDEWCEQLRPLCDAHGMTFRCDPVTDVSTPVAVDGKQMMRVLHNLIGNAIKFSAKGDVIRVRVSVGGDVVRVSVEDNGRGIAADQLPNVFKRFWKAEPGDRRGLGLGLTIARGIVEAHGGRIGVESVEGNGSTFWFTLPVLRNDPGARGRGSAGERVASAGFARAGMDG